MNNDCKHVWIHDWIETGIDGLMRQIIYCSKCEEVKK